MSEPIATLSLYEQGRRQTLMDLGFDIDGIDTATAVEAARLALIHRPVTNPMYPRPICEDDGQEWPCKTAIVGLSTDERIALARAHLSAGEDVAALALLDAVLSTPDGEGPWRDDQGYWLGGMGTPDTGPNIMEAWGIIANAGGGDWTTQTQEWQDAAARWRDRVISTPRKTSDTVRIGSKTYLAGTDDD